MNAKKAERVNLGSSIKAMRESKGLSLTSLAERLALSQIHLISIEQGRYETRKDILAKIIKYLDGDIKILENYHKSALVEVN